MRFSPKIIYALLFIFFFNAFDNVFAAQVAAVKDTKVLVIGDNLEEGSLYYTVTQGKKRGIIKIIKIKGRKGLAKLLKGKAVKGYTLVFRPRKGKSSPRTTAKPSPAPRASGGKNYDVYSESPKSNFKKESSYSKSTSGWKKNFIGFGGLLSYNMNTADVTFSDGASESLSGSSIGFKAFGDYQLTENIGIRGEFGTIPFEADGKNSSGNCATPDSCAMSINYLGGTLWARYMLGTSVSKARFWGGAGASLIFPLATDGTTAVNADGVGSTIIFGFGGGVDYKINDKFYIPASLEYSLFPPNDEVSASSIVFKAGLGMRL